MTVIMKNSYFFRIANVIACIESVAASFFSAAVAFRPIFPHRGGATRAMYLPRPVR